MAGFFSALLDPNTKAKYKIKKPNQAPTTQPSRVSTNRFAMNVRPGDTLGGDIIGGKSGPVFEATSPGDAINRIARNYTVDVGDATSRIIQDTFLGGRGQSNLLDYSLVQPNTGITALDNIVKYNPTNLLLGNVLNNKDFTQMLAPGDVIPIEKGVSLGVKALPYAKPAIRAGVKGASRARLADALSSGGINDLAEASIGSALDAIKSQKANKRIMTQLDKAIKAGGGRIEGVSDLFARMASMGLSYDDLATLPANTLEKVFKHKGALDLTGDYIYEFTMTPTAKQLLTRVRSLGAGTKQRLLKEGDIELKDYNVEEAPLPIGGEIGRMLDELSVEIPESLPTEIMLAADPKHLMDEWLKFSAEHPRAPGVARRFREGETGWSLGPHGEHPLAAATNRQALLETGGTMGVPINDAMFWLYAVINQMKGKKLPDEWVPKFIEEHPELVSLIMPEGGYVRSGWEKSIAELQKLDPEYLDIIRQIIAEESRK